jgi:16S rRNA (cytosine1402-N4)-methyltransferase
MAHVPVLLQETIQLLDPRGGEFFIDGTFGGGGHSLVIAKKIAPKGTLLALDRDPERISEGEKFFSEHFGLGVRFLLRTANYATLPAILAQEKLHRANGLLLDLGFSSLHVDDPERGFSFQGEGPLDMRYDQRNGITAAEVVNSFGEDALAEIFKVYGEESAFRPIAAAIIAARKKERIFTVGALRRIVETIKTPARERGIHPATKIFQALRIYVNDEMKNLSALLAVLPECMAPGGRVGIISFHGVEDGIVKTAFKKFSEEGVAELLTKKPIIASEEESEENSRARSAKLRGIRFV